MHKKFLEPAKFTNWTVVSFAPNASIEALGKFVDGLLREARERGKFASSLAFNQMMTTIRGQPGIGNQIRPSVI
jgi:hypothetical protein